MIIECRKCGKEFKIPNNYSVNRGYFQKVRCPHCNYGDPIPEDQDEDTGERNA